MKLINLIVGACISAVVSAQNINNGGSENFTSVGTNFTTNTTYSNPIMTLNVGDPWMTQYHINNETWYLFTYSTNDNITLKRPKSLTDNWDHAEEIVVFNPDPNSGLPYATDLWAPEIHNISNLWYIIFSATPDRDSPPPLQDAMCTYSCPAVNHRMFVLQSSSSDPWKSTYTIKGQLDTFDQFAIDGTYFQHEGNLYHIYSCWENTYSGWPANLCITQLSDPWTVSSTLYERRMISVPNEPWEQVPYGSGPFRLATNEGPEQLTNPTTGQNFVIYSAARVNTPFYCLGMLELVGNDPMEYQSWRKARDGCVFAQNGKEGVYGTGHASFTKSVGGEEDWVVYHAQTTRNPESDIYRTVRTQKFGWNEDGTPNFPLAANGPFPVPAGQKS